MKRDVFIVAETNVPRRCLRLTLTWYYLSYTWHSAKILGFLRLKLLFRPQESESLFPNTLSVSSRPYLYT